MSLCLYLYVAIALCNVIISYVCACHFLAFQAIHFPALEAIHFPALQPNPRPIRTMIRLIFIIFQLIFSHVNQPQRSAYDGLQMIDIFKSCQPLASWLSWLSWPSWPLSCLPWASPAPNHYEAEHKSLAKMTRQGLLAQLVIQGFPGPLNINGPRFSSGRGPIFRGPQGGACSSRSDADVTVSTKLLEALAGRGVWASRTASRMAGCGPM